MSPEEHQKLKALAALQRKSIKDFVCASTPSAAKTDEKAVLLELEELLNRRLARAKTEGTSERTIEDIFHDTKP